MEKRIRRALGYIERYGGIDGGHHKQWVLDQVVRALLGCPVNGDDQGESEAYQAWVRAMCMGEDGPDSYDWDTGIAP